MNRIEREKQTDEVLTFDEATRFVKVSAPTLRKALKRFFYCETTGEREMNEHLYDMSNVVITCMNGETIGELPENVETFCPDASPAPPTFEPVEIEIELHTEHAKELWEMIDRKRSDVYKDFYQAYLDGKISIIDLYRVADALGIEIY